MTKTSLIISALFLSSFACGLASANDHPKPASGAETCGDKCGMQLIALSDDKTKSTEESILKLGWKPSLVPTKLEVVGIYTRGEQVLMRLSDGRVLYTGDSIEVKKSTAKP